MVPDPITKVLRKFICAKGERMEVNSISKEKCNRRLINRAIALVLSFGLVLTLVMIPAKKVDAKSTEITEMYLSFDKTNADLNIVWMESEVSNRFSNSVASSSNKYPISHECSYLASKEADGTFKNLSSSYENVSASKSYYYALTVVLDGYTLKGRKVEDYKGKPKALTDYPFNILVDAEGDSSFANISETGYLLLADDYSMATFFLPAGEPATKGRIAGISFYPGSDVSIEKGEEKTFHANVRANSDVQEAYWSISGNNSSKTKVVKKDSTTAVVSVDANETASDITLRAYTKESTIYKTIQIRIGTSTEISRVDINYDEDMIYLAPGCTEGEVNTRIYGASSISGTNYHLGTQGNITLLYDDAGAPKGVLNGQMYGIYDGTGSVDAGKDYYIAYQLYHTKGYQWPKSIINKGFEVHPIKNYSELSVYTNGTLNTNVYVSYNPGHEYIVIYVPIDIWKIDIQKNAAKLSVSGITDKTYTGSAITQAMTVTYDGKPLTEGTDYTVTYSNNVNVGTANVTITGTGSYKGSVTKTFKINAAAGQSNGGSTGTTAPKYSNEWVNGKWYNADGTQTYQGILEWKCNSTGWWVEDSSGWYPVSQWQKIDGKWYYFTDTGYMDYSEYRDGYWLGSDGAMVDGYYGEWKSDSKGWWFEDISGWYPQSQWVWIDGVNYYFDADGYWTGTGA